MFPHVSHYTKYSIKRIVYKSEIIPADFEAVVLGKFTIAYSSITKSRQP